MNTISPLAYVHPDAKLGDNNIIGPFCYIDADVVIGDNNVLQNSVTLNQGLRMGNGNEIMPGASISTKPQDLKFKGEITTCQIGDNNSIRENVTISRGTFSKGTTIVGSNNLLMENMHIAHDCVIGNGCIIGNSTQGGCRTSQDIPPYVIAGKEPIRFAGLNLIGLRRRGFDNDTILAIREAYNTIYSKGIIKEGLEEVRNTMTITPEIQYVLDFIEKAERGIIR